MRVVCGVSGVPGRTPGHTREQYENDDVPFSVLPPRDVSRVIGPLDELRMHDLNLGAAKKAKPLPPALRKALRRTGARACPYCENCGRRGETGAATLG